MVDAPRVAYRAVMIDVARNFLDKHFILRLLDVMAMYKMNALHLHLTDNQGWRLEVPALPELTEVVVGLVVTFFYHNFVNCKATLVWRLKIDEIKYNISLNDIHI